MVEFRPELGFRAEQDREFYNSDQIIELIVAKPVILASAVLELIRTAVQLDTTIICLFVAIQSNLHPKPRCFVSRTWQKQVPALWASADQCCPVSPQAQSWKPCEHYGIELETHHRALCDARATGHLLNLMNFKREGCAPDREEAA